MQDYQFLLQEAYQLALLLQTRPYLQRLFPLLPWLKVLSKVKLCKLEAAKNLDKNCMGMIGNYRRISPEQLSVLQKEPQSVVNFLFAGCEAEKVAELEGRYLNIDKTWHAIHFLLTGTPLSTQPPLGNVVMGDTLLGDLENIDFDFGVRFLTASEVQEVAKAISAISQVQLQARFDPRALYASDVYPTELWKSERQTVEDLIAYVSSYYISLVKFFQKAAECGEVVLLYIT